MNTILMNSESSKSSHPHRLLLNLTDKIDLRRGKRSVALNNINNIKFKISAPTWNDKCELPDGSYLDQHYFDYLLKNMGKILIIHQ